MGPVFDINLNDELDSTIHKIHPGEEFIVEGTENPSTGYSWMYDLDSKGGCGP